MYGTLLNSLIEPCAVYDYYGTRTISYVHLIGEPVIWTSSMEVAKQLLSNDPKLIKAPSALVPLLYERSTAQTFPQC